MDSRLAILRELREHPGYALLVEEMQRRVQGADRAHRGELTPWQAGYHAGEAAALEYVACGEWLTAEIAKEEKKRKPKGKEDP